jgi:hypothetical protein
VPALSCIGLRWIVCDGSVSYLPFEFRNSGGEHVISYGRSRWEARPRRNPVSDAGRAPRQRKGAASGGAATGSRGMGAARGPARSGRDQTPVTRRASAPTNFGQSLGQVAAVSLIESNFFIARRSNAKQRLRFLAALPREWPAAARHFAQRHLQGRCARLGPC